MFRLSVSILLSMTVASIMMLPLMAQPLSLGLIIMLLTLLMCVISAMLLSSWYGYILFLIYVGGLLVMFVYVAALSPNVHFGKMPMVSLFLGLVLGFMIFSKYFIDCSSLAYSSSFVGSKVLKVYGSELTSPLMISILVGLGLILLINLVAVVKICYYQHASLRPFNEI